VRWICLPWMWLPVALKHLNPTVDKRISGTLQMPHPVRFISKIAVIGSEEHCLWAERRGIPNFTAEKLRAFHRNRPVIKRVFKRFNQTLCSKELIRQIPRLLGPALHRMNNFPRVIAGSMEQEMTALKSIVRIRQKRCMHISLPVGHVQLTADQLRHNLVLAMNFIASLCPKGWGNIKGVHIKSSMGPSVDVWSPAGVARPRR